VKQEQENYTFGKFLINIVIKFLYIIIIPVMIYEIFIIVKSYKSPDSAPNIFGYKIFTIISRSMEPEINIDDVIFVKECNEKEIFMGDIITFEIDDEIITHRVVNIEKHKDEIIYTTKGDSNKFTDVNQVEFWQIKGKYIWKIPKMGKLFNFLRNKYVFGVIIFLLLIILIFDRLKNSKKQKRKEKRKKYERKQERKKETAD